MRKKNLNNKGFSLVELIIVVAIISVLTAVLAPQLIKYLGKAKKTVCHENMNTIDEAIQLEIAEYNRDYNKFGYITDLSSIKYYDGTKCDSGGTYDIEVKKVSNDNYTVIIKCSEHGQFGQ